MRSADLRRGRDDGLLPLSDLRARLDAALTPVAVTHEPPFAAIGAVLAANVVGEAPVPATARALCRGIAVASAQTIGASPYAPVVLSGAFAVEIGAALPAGCDAVVRDDAVERRGGTVLVTETVAPWTDADPPGASLGPAARAARAGDRVGPLLAHVATLLGHPTLPVRRPRITIGHDGSVEATAAARTLAAMLPGTAVRIGPHDTAADEPGDLLLAIGVGDHNGADPAVERLAAQGRLDGIGVGLAPCEAIAWGVGEGAVGERPALVLPRRLDALVTAAVALVLPSVRRLSGAAEPTPFAGRALSRKIVSRIGLTEIALLGEREDGRWEPLGIGHRPWPALLAARAWIELGPESEGLADGATVVASPLEWCPPVASGGMS